MLTIVVVIVTVISCALTVPGGGLTQIVPTDSSQEVGVVGSVKISILRHGNGGTEISSDPLAS